MPSAPKPEPRVRKRLAVGRTLAAPTKPMAAFSRKRRALYDDAYLPARARFLEAHPDCEMRITTPRICTGKATEVQHMLQRSLTPGAANLLDESHWLAACHECNSWAGIHPAEAIALGVELDPRAVTEQEA